jgi:hypothetical protein
VLISAISIGCLFFMSAWLSTAFISVLHLYETFGWSRKADYIKVHFAESWNEFHHLLIMEVRLNLSFTLVKFRVCEGACLPFVPFACINLFSILLSGEVITLNEFIPLITRFLARIRNWVATPCFLIGSLLGSWHFFTTS